MRSLLFIVFTLISITASATTTTFNFTGAQQTFVVPAGVTSININTMGASGWSGTNPGGKGGSASGDLAVTPGEILYIYVGGQGTVASGNRIPAGGGFNGGGDGQSNTSGSFVGGGGGASDIRQGGITLTDRVLVAAGGGGSTNNSTSFGGDGGGLIGVDGGRCSSSVCIASTAGSQIAGGSAGGSLGQGGNADNTMTPWNGGGGGGYYGGGVSIAHSGGSGGSSYLGGVSNGATTTGVQVGDGIIVLDFTPGVLLPATPIPTNTFWVLILLGSLMLGIGVLFTSQHKSQ